jgi:hypothetical protein
LLTDNDILSLLKSGTIDLAECILLRNLVLWLKQAKANNVLPGASVDQWKNDFTADVISQFSLIQAGITTSSTTPLPSPNTPSTSNAPSIQGTNVSSALIKTNYGAKLSDYPDFDGKQKSWFKFKKMLVATTGIDKCQDVLSVSDNEIHNNKRTIDSTYNDHVEHIYNVLVCVTAGSTALSTVKKYKSTKDGALAWKALKDYYDNEGNKEIHDATIILELLDLHLEYNSASGMDNYLHQFEKHLAELQYSNVPLSDELKLTFLFCGIHDTAYDTAKDICKKLTYQ